MGNEERQNEYERYSPLYTPFHKTFINHAMNIFIVSLLINTKRVSYHLVIRITERDNTENGNFPTNMIPTTGTVGNTGCSVMLLLIIFKMCL